MTLLAPPQISTAVEPDDLLKMDGLFELVNGQLIEKQMSSVSGETAGIVTSVLVPFIRENRLGVFFVETSFRCFPNNARQVRRPDMSFIAEHRLSQVPETGHVPIAPDLAIEVVSPGDVVYELDEKLLDYRSARIPLIWVINPHSRVIRIFRPGQPIEELIEGDQLKGGNVLPGFTTPVADLFPQPQK